MRLCEITSELNEAKLTGPYRPRRTAAEKFRAGMKRAGYDMDAAAKRMQDFLDQQARQRAELDQKYAELDQKSQKLLKEYDQYVIENLRKWFREKWVRFGPDGKIRGDCARGDDSEGKPKCLPQAKAHALGKKGRKTAASRKRREDPNPERSGPAINVKTKESTGVAEGISIVDQDSDLDQQVFTLNVDGNKVSFTYWDYESNFENPDIKDIFQQAKEQLSKKLSPEQIKDVARIVFKSFEQGVAEGKHSCPECGGPAYEDQVLAEKQDACYHKVKSRYKVWPSAYASGALVQCRKKGAKNWGNKSK